MLFLFVITTSYSQLLIFEQVNRIRDIVLKKVLYIYIYIYIESFVVLWQHSLHSKVRNLFCDCVSIRGSIRNYISSIENPNKPRVKIFALNKKRNSLPSPFPSAESNFTVTTNLAWVKLPLSFGLSRRERTVRWNSITRLEGKKNLSLSLSLRKQKKRGKKEEPRNRRRKENTILRDLNVSVQSKRTSGCWIARVSPCGVQRIPKVCFACLEYFTKEGDRQRERERERRKTDLDSDHEGRN